MVFKAFYIALHFITNRGSIAWKACWGIRLVVDYIYISKSILIDVIFEASSQP